MNDKYPVIVEVEYPESSSRILALLAIPFFVLKIILLIPHLVVLYFLQIVATIAAWLGIWVVLFTGKYPRGIFNFVVGVTRWQTRTSVWLLGLTDKYPPFGF